MAPPDYSIYYFGDLSLSDLSFAFVGIRILSWKHNINRNQSRFQVGIGRVSLSYSFMRSFVTRPRRGGNRRIIRYSAWLDRVSIPHL